jgi:hypothetical protein
MPQSIKLLFREKLRGLPGTISRNVASHVAGHVGHQGAPWRHPHSSRQALDGINWHQMIAGGGAGGCRMTSIGAFPNSGAPKRRALRARNDSQYIQYIYTAHCYRSIGTYLRDRYTQQRLAHAPRCTRRSPASLHCSKPKKRIFSTQKSAASSPEPPLTAYCDASPPPSMAANPCANARRVRGRGRGRGGGVLGGAFGAAAAMPMCCEALGPAAEDVGSTTRAASGPAGAGTGPGAGSAASAAGMPGWFSMEAGGRSKADT